MSNYSRINKARLTIHFSDEEGNNFEATLPNVEIFIESNIREGERWDDGFISYYSPSIVDSLRIEGMAYPSKKHRSLMTIRLIETDKNRKKKK